MRTLYVGSARNLRMVRHFLMKHKESFFEISHQIINLLFNNQAPANIPKRSQQLYQKLFQI